MTFEQFMLNQYKKGIHTYQESLIIYNNSFHNTEDSHTQNIVRQIYNNFKG